MSVNVKQGKKAIAVAAMAVVSAAIAATLIHLDPPVVVSTSDPANNAFKAKMGWISYKIRHRFDRHTVRRSGPVAGLCRRPAGRAGYLGCTSIDNGATWTQTKLLPATVTR